MFSSESVYRLKYGIAQRKKSKAVNSTERPYTEHYVPRYYCIKYCVLYLHLHYTKSVTFLCNVPVTILKAVRLV
jgi:hypothetical protein